MKFQPRYMTGSLPAALKSITLYLLLAAVALTMPSQAVAAAVPDGDFVVVLDAGHGGKDVGATDHGAREKDINLAVARRVGELIKKKMKDVRVVYTRDDDTFISLQGRADVANSNKADLFVSIHTNSVDKSNRNRNNVAGSSVYALGLHKDDNNMNVARRENSVIELEGDYEQKYSGFDPNRDESYIIFEMAQKRNLAQSIKFANEVQKNLVDIAGRKDRGVHQAGFWVLWATSMPSVLIELDFICNPESARFMTSKDGVDKLAEGIFKAIKSYKERTKGAAPQKPAQKNSDSKKNASRNQVRESRSVEEIMADSRESGLIDDKPEFFEVIDEPQARNSVRKETAVATPGNRQSGPRRRRSARAAVESAGRTYEQGAIALLSETEGSQMDSGERKTVASANTEAAKSSDGSGRKDKKDKKKNKKDKKENRKHVRAGKDTNHLKTVYTIQLMASEEQLSGSNPGFHGFSPIYAFRENNLYKYTYGEASTKEEIAPLLEKVREKIPDAFIVTKRRSR